MSETDRAVVDFLREHIIGQEDLDVEGNVAVAGAWCRASLARALSIESPSAFAVAQQLGAATRDDRGSLRPKLTVLPGGKAA